MTVLLWISPPPSPNSLSMVFCLFLFGSTLFFLRSLFLRLLLPCTLYFCLLHAPSLALTIVSPSYSLASLHTSFICFTSFFPCLILLSPTVSSFLFLKLSFFEAQALLFFNSLFLSLSLYFSCTLTSLTFYIYTYTLYILCRNVLYVYFSPLGIHEILTCTAGYSLFNKMDKTRPDGKAFPTNLYSFKHASIE